MAYDSVVDIDREESRSAREAAEREGDDMDCYEHHYRRYRNGDGVCECGATVDRDEL